jgi:hypothetical protein
MKRKIKKMGTNEDICAQLHEIVTLFEF